MSKLKERAKRKRRLPGTPNPPSGVGYVTRGDERWVVGSPYDSSDEEWVSEKDKQAAADRARRSIEDYLARVRRQWPDMLTRPSLRSSTRSKEYR